MSGSWEEATTGLKQATGRTSRLFRTAAREYRSRMKTYTTLLGISLGLAACTPAGDSAPAASGSDTAQTTAAAPAERLSSPRDTARGTIGSASLLVDYGRPSRRGRQIFGSLVPYDEVWRTGANAATTLVVGAPVELGGEPLPAGTYTLYSIPAQTGWTLIVNRQTRQWGTEYTEGQDVMRVPMSVSRVEPVDTFGIAVEGGAAEGRLVFAWDTLQGTVAVRAR